MTKMPQTAIKQYLAQSREIFYCQFKIKIPLDYGEKIIDDCFDIANEIDQKYNSYSSQSYFSKINKNAGEWTEVDRVTIDILKTIKQISEITNGAYDVTVMPLINLWGFYSKEPVLPNKEQILKALQFVNYNAIEIDSNKVRIQKNQEIITGSFVKAFAVDRIVTFLKSNNITDAIINAGGSSIYGLNDASHPNWFINLPNVSDQSQAKKRISITNQSFSFSGKTNNHIVINNKKYSHIIHAKTGKPSDTNQVFVLSESAFLGDVLSTALFVTAPNDLKNTVEKLQQLFSFDFQRIEENGEKNQNKCF